MIESWLIASKRNGGCNRPVPADYWFLRRRSGWCTSISPAAPMGYLMTALYAATVCGLAWLVKVHPSQSPVWATMIVSATLVFVVAAYRLSAPVDRS